MADHGDYYFFLKEIFPGVGPELARLLQSAVENTNLLGSDFFTIRDWLEIARYSDHDEALALLLLMLIALEEGSVCIEIAAAPLASRLRDLAPDTEADAWAHRIVAALTSAGFPALIGGNPNDSRPLILRALAGRQFLYFQKYLRAELEFQEELTRRVAQPAHGAGDWSPIVQRVLESQPLHLDPDQKMALAAALFNNFAVISGGPGTGKTSIVLTLLRCLTRSGVPVDRIKLAAPTGRAAQRLSDSLRAGLARLPSATDDEPLGQLQASTLHQLLGYRPTRNIFTRHRENPIDADVVIVDEVSMVGLVLMSQLLQALSPTTRLVLLGDKDQLPSIDAGAVLASLIPEDFHNGFFGDAADRLSALFADSRFAPARSTGALQNRVVMLQTNHRSQEQIRAAAQAINQQDAGIVERLPPLAWPESARLDTTSGCYFLEQSLATAAEIRGFVKRWIEEAYFQCRVDGKTLAELLDDGTADDEVKRRRLFSLVDQFRLLTLVRDGAWGCNEINRFSEIILRPRLDPDTRSPLFVGAPVLITRNDSARGLFNGDVGVALRDRQGGLRVLFDRQEGSMSFPAESLPAHELGFALTVHKSQGSEYQHVMLVVPPTGGRRLLTKELIYTAMTRAKSLAVICSTKASLELAISRRIVRESALSYASFAGAPSGS